MRTTIVDGAYLSYRAYCAGGIEGLNRHTLSVLLGLLDSSDCVWVAWENPSGGGSDLRREIYPAYKSRRGAKPQEYFTGLQAIRDAATVLGINQAYPAAGEADDVAHTLTVNLANGRDEVALWTRDKDWFQLLSRPGVSVILPAAKGLGADTELRGAELQSYFGVPPELVVDFLALAGDTSDDVPGMPRIGAKRAAELLRACPDLVGEVLDGRGDAAVAMVLATDAGLAPHAARVAENPDLLRDMRDLVQLRDVKLDTTMGKFDRAAAEAALVGLGCQGLLPRLARLGVDPWTETVEIDAVDDWGE